MVFVPRQARSSQLHVLGLGRRADLVALGDSNTALTHLRPRSPARWPDIVGRQLELSVRNLGREGGTIRDAFDQGLVERAMSSGARYVAIAFAVDDSHTLELSEFAGLLDRLLFEVETTVMTPLLVTGVWLDYPAHCSTNAVNEALQPFNDAIRSAASDRDVRLVDVAARMEKETARGHWDLRIRKGATDDRQDADKTVESGWWDDVHLNETGSRLVAHLVVQALRQDVRVAQLDLHAVHRLRAALPPSRLGHWSGVSPRGD